VGSLAELSSGLELEQRVLALHAQGKADEEIAQELTASGFRSPKAPKVLVNTVKLLRLKHRRFVTRHQSHPRHSPGALTVPQLARALALSVHWFYDRINNGRIQLRKDPTMGLYLFPDQPTTLERLQQLRDGQLDKLRF
jgi:predicted DNA-binding transcriptional regulator AlpA